VCACCVPSCCASIARTTSHLLARLPRQARLPTATPSSIDATARAPPSNCPIATPSPHHLRPSNAAPQLPAAFTSNASTSNFDDAHNICTALSLSPLFTALPLSSPLHDATLTTRNRHTNLLHDATLTAQPTPAPLLLFAHALHTIRPTLPLFDRNPSPIPPLRPHLHLLARLLMHLDPYPPLLARVPIYTIHTSLLARIPIYTNARFSLPNLLRAPLSLVISLFRGPPSFGLSQVSMSTLQA
jgi:hypothetical protein